MDETRIEDIGSGSGAAGTETVDANAGLGGQSADAGAGMNNGGDDTIKTGFANGSGEGEEPTAEKAAAAEAQQEEARASEAAEQMDEDTTKAAEDTECDSQNCKHKADCEVSETQVEDPPDAKHPQIAFDPNTGEQCDVEIGDRVVCYCKGNRVVMDVVDKHDNNVFVGVNQSDSEFLTNMVKIKPYDRLIFTIGDVFELAVQP